MEKVLIAILSHLEQLNIPGKEAERLAAIKSMVRDLIKALRANDQEKGENAV